jgi:uncharacterized protein (DUF433 family)
MAAAGRIEINPKIMLGKPVIRGTRIPVEQILRKLGEGATEADLLDAYPNLEPEDIRAARVVETVDQEEERLAGASVVLRPTRTRVIRLSAAEDS